MKTIMKNMLANVARVLSLPFLAFLAYSAIAAPMRPCDFDAPCAVK